MQEEAQASLYDQLGHREGISAVVHRLYELIGADPSVSYYFDETGMPVESLIEFLVNISGGPANPNYHMPDLAVVHKKFHISEKAFATVATYLQQAMQEKGVAPDTIATVMKVVGGTHDQIVADPVNSPA